jgi:hypothetical protein
MLRVLKLNLLDKHILKNTITGPHIYGFRLQLILLAILRGNYASVGHTWDVENQIFWYFKPFPSWVKDISIANWKSPIGDAPDDLTDEEKAAFTHYAWNEAGQSWDKTIL